MVQFLQLDLLTIVTETKLICELYQTFNDNNKGLLCKDKSKVHVLHHIIACCYTFNPFQLVVTSVTVVYVISCRFFWLQYRPFIDGRREKQQSVSILSFAKYGKFINTKRPVIDAYTHAKKKRQVFLG